MGSLERGRRLEGKRVILVQLLLVLFVDEDLKGGVEAGRRRRTRMGILGKVWVFLGKRRRRERWGRVEIGRDAAAFCSDLYFRFFLMHYISEKLKDEAPQLQNEGSKIERGKQRKIKRNRYPLLEIQGLLLNELNF
ncbi:beta-carotene isomerase D27 [Striga asiatica]|uniref:Beta-carotene isomerase D27 n=1 Tax=Striga asiatica TaxID=4170 RepID=A0A5A7QFN5_STRAF|nr:beta-carotene isomerase D27 [Striga asiatica]